MIKRRVRISERERERESVCVCVCVRESLSWDTYIVFSFLYLYLSLYLSRLLFTTSSLLRFIIIKEKLLLLFVVFIWISIFSKSDRFGLVFVFLSRGFISAPATNKALCFWCLIIEEVKKKE